MPAYGEEQKIGLALSGGGFRATLFHLGGLTRLNEIGLLARLGCISGISGGSVAAVYLGLKWSKLEFDENGVAVNLNAEIVEPIREFCGRNIDLAPTIANAVAMLFGGVTSTLSGQYRILFGSATLQDLPDDNTGPRFIIGASNLQTGARVWFSREHIRELRLGIYDSPSTSLSEVVAASTAFPPFLSPVVIRTDANKWRRGIRSDLYDEIPLRARLVLTDGGIHDPSAVDPLLDEHGLILVSDGSKTREVWRRPSSSWFRQLNRTTIMQTVTNSEGHRLALGKAAWAEDLSAGKRKVIWWCNGDRIDDYELDDAMTRDSEKTISFGSMRTRLNRFNSTEQGRLINWGYALCDAALRSRGDLDLVNAPKPTWPDPQHVY